jgi:hypothetical protein
MVINKKFLNIGGSFLSWVLDLKLQKKVADASGNMWEPIFRHVTFLIRKKLFKNVQCSVRFKKVNPDAFNGTRVIAEGTEQ